MRSVRFAEAEGSVFTFGFQADRSEGRLAAAFLSIRAAKTRLKRAYKKLTGFGA